MKINAVTIFSSGLFQVATLAILLLCISNITTSFYKMPYTFIQKQKKRNFASILSIKLQMEIK